MDAVIVGHELAKQEVLKVVRQTVSSPNPDGILSRTRRKAGVREDTICPESDGRGIAETCCHTIPLGGTGDGSAFLWGQIVPRVQKRLSTTLGLEDSTVSKIMKACHQDSGLRQLEQNVDHVISSQILSQVLKDGKHLDSNFIDKCLEDLSPEQGSPPPSNMYS